MVHHLAHTKVLTTEMLTTKVLTTKVLTRATYLVPQLPSYFVNDTFFLSLK